MFQVTPWQTLVKHSSGFGSDEFFPSVGVLSRVTWRRSGRRSPLKWRKKKMMKCTWMMEGCHVKSKITLNYERKLILDGSIFHFHDYKKKGKKLLMAVPHVVQVPTTSPRSWGSGDSRTWIGRTNDFMQDINLKKHIATRQPLQPPAA